MSKKPDLPASLKLQVLFENKLAAIFITQPDGSILDVNHTAVKMFGHTVDEFRQIGREGVIDGDSPGLIEKLKERDENGAVSGELTAIRKGGEKFPCDFSSSIYVDDNGERYTATFLIDITDRKKAELHSKIFLNNTEEAFILLDKNLMIVAFNDQYKRLFRSYYGIDIVIGDHVLKYAQPERKKLLKETFEKVLVGGNEQSNLIFTLPDQSEKVYSMSYKPARDDQDEITGVFILAREITESFNVRQSNERFRYVTKATSDAIWDLELKTGKLIWGEGFKTLFGYSDYENEKGYDDWREKIHPDDVEDVEKRVKEILLSDEDTWQQEYRFLRANGLYDIVLDKGIIIRNGKGKPQRLIGAIERVTEQKLREYQKTITSEIHRAFNQENKIEKALDRTLEKIQSIGLFAVAEVWIVDNNKENIVLTSSMNSTPEQKEFYKESKKQNSFKKGEGLPGQIWEKKSDLFWGNVDKRKTFIRRDAAKKAGVKTVYGFPILDNNEVLGGIIFGVKNHAKQESYYSVLSNEVSIVLALELRRKRLENELKLIFNSAPDIICIAGFDGYYKKINPAMSDLLGYSEEEILNTPIVEFTHPNDRAKTEEEIKNLIKQKGRLSFENRYITKSGKTVWLSWTTKPIYDQGITFSVAKDVTLQKEAEELLDQANRLAKIGSWKYNLNNKEFFLSQIIKEIHEVEPDYNPTLDKALNFYKEGESRKKISEAIEKATANGIPWDLELQIVTAKGNDKWVRTIGEVELHKGKPVLLYGSFQDIDDRKSVEVAFKKVSEERIEILESIGDGFFVVDREYIVTYWNQRAEELTHVSKEEILGRNLWELFQDAKENSFFKKYNEAIREQKTAHFEEFERELKRWFEISAYPSQSGLSVYFKDITERKASEELLYELNQSLEQKAKELATSNADLENFAFVASHDLQEPLRMITSFLAQLENKYDHVLDDKGKKYIYYATDGAKRMRQIILDLLEYSRVGRLNTERSYVDLNEIVKDIQLLYKRLIREKKAVIKSDNLPKIWGARSPLQQILQNLVHNGLNYSRDDVKPEIVITSEESGNFWKISVSDNGIGIHPDSRGKIFNLFQRLHNNEKYSGTGLGLAISKKIIEDHGGEIWVDSEEGKGSTFHFTIEKRSANTSK